MSISKGSVRSSSGYEQWGLTFMKAHSFWAASLDMYIQLALFLLPM